MTSLNTLSITTLEEGNISGEYDPRNILQLVAKVFSSQNTPRHQGFLPNLKILDYTGELRLRPGNYDEIYTLPPANYAFRGPLHLVKLELLSEIYIPENMISYLSTLVERGVTVKVLSKSKDILQSSIEHHFRLGKF